MPAWDKEKKRYVEESVIEVGQRELEERFRTALLNELDALTDAVLRIDEGTFRVRSE